MCKFIIYLNKKKKDKIFVKISLNFKHTTQTHSSKQKYIYISLNEFQCETITYMYSYFVHVLKTIFIQFHTLLILVSEIFLVLFICLYHSFIPCFFFFFFFFFYLLIQEINKNKKENMKYVIDHKNLFI